MNSSETRQGNVQWQPVKLPYICERMIAFTIPSLESVLVLSYEGLHIIDLAWNPKVRTIKEHAEDYRIYNVETHTLHFNGCIYHTLGLHGGIPLLDDNEGNALRIDAQRQFVCLDSPQGTRLDKLPYDDYSGDWVHATFARDRRMVLIGVPHALYVYRKTSTL